MSSISQIGDWVPLRRLGTGASCLVYECVHCDDPAWRGALKILRSDADERFRPCLDRETRLLGRLGRLGLPGVPALLDAGFFKGAPFLVSTYVQGVTLHELVLERGALPAAEALRLAGSAAHTLSALHRLGITHRDIKPANLIHSTTGELAIIDFGSARDLLAADPSDEPSTAYSPSYVAPEVAFDGVETTAQDVYSLALVLVEMLSGSGVFPGNVADVFRRRRHAGPVDPGRAHPDALRWLVRRMTARDPAERPDAAEVVEAIARLEVGAPSAGGSPSSSVHDRRALMGTAGLAVLSMASMAMALAVTGVVLASRLDGTVKPLHLAPESAPESTPATPGVSASDGPPSYVFATRTVETAKARGVGERPSSVGRRGASGAAALARVIVPDDTERWLLRQAGREIRSLEAVPPGVWRLFRRGGSGDDCWWPVGVLDVRAGQTLRLECDPQTDLCEGVPTSPSHARVYPTR